MDGRIFNARAQKVCGLKNLGVRFLCASVCQRNNGAVRVVLEDEKIMKIKSLQLSIMFYAGFAVLSVVAILVLYALISGEKTQNWVGDKTREILGAEVKEHLISLSKYQISQIQRQLDQPIEVAKYLARANVLAISKPSFDLNAEGDYLSDLALDALAQNSALLTTYIAWEPTGLFERNAAGVVSARERFLPLWSRAEAGKYNLSKLQSMESEALLPTGVREGEYYLCPKENHSACATDPVVYTISGKSIQLTAFTAPIIVQGEFKGIAGASLNLEFLQELLEKANRELYGGAGEMALISGNGRFVAFTGKASKIGGSASEIFGEGLVNSFSILNTADENYSLDQKGMIQVTIRFPVANTATKWTLLVRLPENVVFKSVSDLKGLLEQHYVSEARSMGLVGLVVSGFGILIVGFVARGIVRPLQSMLAMIKNIAKGEGDLTQRLSSSRADELGCIAQEFNVFLGTLQSLISKVINSTRMIADSTSDGVAMATQTHQGMLSQQSDVEQVATAINEMTASSQDVAANAMNAAKATGHAEQAVSDGKVAMEDAVAAINSLAIRMENSVKAIKILEESSNDIGAVVTAIRAIAEQTNLLALNAAIEAARAGDHGRGFAVVADEVRSLAQKTQLATEEVRLIIERLQGGSQSVTQSMLESHTHTQSCLQQAHLAAQTFLGITASVNIINEMNNQIAAAAEQQSQVAEEINFTITGMGQITDQVATAARKALESGSTLRSLSQQQCDLIAQFRV